MGLASWALGEDNAFSQYVADNKHLVHGAFVGLGQGKTLGQGLGQAALYARQGGLMDDVARQQKAEEAKAVEQANKTAAYLRQQGADQWADAIEISGMSGMDAYKGYLEGQQAPEAAKPTSAIQEYEYARSQGYEGSFQEYETAMKQAGATNIDFNNSQALAGGYADRMSAANAILDDPKLTTAQTDPVQAGMGAIPGIGNYLTSAERQMAEQAQRDFVNAILRRESGAAIAPSEFESAAKQYFPQPGDSPEVIEQKRVNRQIAIQGVGRAAGPAYQPPPSVGAGGGVVDFSTYFGGQ